MITDTTRKMDVNELCKLIEKYAIRSGGIFSLWALDKMNDGDKPETNEVKGNIYENPKLRKKHSLL